MSSEIKVNTISEVTSANGVSIDGLNIKDSAINTGAIGDSVTGNWGWKLLQTVTASGSSDVIEIGTSSNLTSTYPTYKVLMTDFVIPSSANIRGFFEINGSYNSTQSYDYNTYGRDANDNQTVENTNAQTYFVLIPSAFNNITDNIGVNAEMTLSLPNESKWHSIRYTTDHHNNNNLANWGIGTASHRRHQETGDKGPLTGLKFSTSTGANIVRGTLRLYGVINA